MEGSMDGQQRSIAIDATRCDSVKALSLFRSHDSQGRGGEEGRGGRKEEERRAELRGREKERLHFLHCALPSTTRLCAFNISTTEISFSYLSLSCFDSRLPVGLGYLDTFHHIQLSQSLLGGAVYICPHFSAPCHSTATNPFLSLCVLSIQREKILFLLASIQLRLD